LQIPLRTLSSAEVRALYAEALDRPLDAAE